MVIEFYEVMKMIYENSAVDGVYMDFDKTNDQVPQARLMQKSKAHCSMEIWSFKINSATKLFQKQVLF